MWRNVQFRCVLCGSVGSGGSVWVMGEWSVGQWIVGVMSFQNVHGLYGLKHTVEISGYVTDAGQPKREDRATQLLICYALSLAKSKKWKDLVSFSNCYKSFKKSNQYLLQ